MAVEASFAMKRKRKRADDGKRKLLVGERVEVRSEEDGFLGSWHPGTVIMCSKSHRHVKYDHLLTDDGADSLVDNVPVSPIVDGLYYANASQFHYRGKIRPLPPPHEFEKRSLHYGFCVDAYYEEAWWEGVIYDHNDGSEERSIFFPDLGDEMTIGIDSLRVTLDWDELTGMWHSRGTWLFLELIEEYKKESYIPVSVKQIWYDLREKNGFKKIKEWTSSVRSLWEELVLEVINDSLEIVVDHVYRVLGFKKSTEPETQSLLELARPVSDLSVYPEVGKSHDIVPVENPWNSNEMNLNCTISQSIPVQKRSNEVQFVTVPKDVEPTTNLFNESDGSGHGKSLHVLPEALMVLTSNQGGSLCNGGDGVSSFKSNNIKRKFKSFGETGNWLPAGPDIALEAEFCPNAITKYAQIRNVENKHSLKMDVRKHLKYLNWKIESRRDDRGAQRVRYISAGKKGYHSLRQVCLDLMKTNTKITSPVSHDHKTLNTIHDDWQSPPPERPEDHWDLDYCPQTVDSSSFELLTVEPAYNPQTVMDWCMLGVDGKHKGNLKRKDMILNARRHLAALGWEFKYVTTGKRILYYYSPNGKRYNSLRSACESCLDVLVGSESSASTSRTMENIVVDEEVDDQLASGKWSSVVSNPKFQKRLVSSNSLSKILSAESMLQSGNRKGKRRIKFSHLNTQTKSSSASLPKFKRGKASRALITLEDSLEDRCRSHVLRSSKRVKQLETPSSSNQHPRTLLSWLIDNNAVLPRAKVVYRTRQKRRPNAEGRITREGIKCRCCGIVYTISSFELHAAGSTSNNPANYIFLEDGMSLLECQQHVLNDGNLGNFTEEQRRRIGNDHQTENDYICSVCHYGGELILCDGCPSSFHKICLGLEDVPDGDWFCPSCCCGICGNSKFREDVENIMDEDTLICYQCEHKFHHGCLQNVVATKSGSPSNENWFCSKKCEEIFLSLHKLLGKPIPIGNDVTWTLLKSTQFDSQSSKLVVSDIEALSKLSIALCVMHECFEPVCEPHTGRDLVEDVIFGRGSKLNRLNFRGFYTVLLEKKEELISVATVRIYGEKAAEVPLVGTRFKYRRLGMCRILMNELEKKLMELGVQRLILPAIPSVLNTWTTSFGFSTMTNSERLKFVDINILDFPDTFMCQKVLLKGPAAELDLSIGDQPKGQYDVRESGDNIDLTGSSTVSEVFQEEQIEDSGIVEQRLIYLGGGAANALLKSTRPHQSQSRLQSNHLWIPI